MGAQMLKEVASKTSDVAATAPTTATVLAQSITGKGQKLVAAGNTPWNSRGASIKRSKVVIAELKKISKPTKGPEEIAQVGTILQTMMNHRQYHRRRLWAKWAKEGVFTVRRGQGHGNHP